MFYRRTEDVVMLYAIAVFAILHK